MADYYSNMAEHEPLVEPAGPTSFDGALIVPEGEDVIVMLDGRMEAELPDELGFYGNLAEHLTPDARRQLAHDLIDKVEVDIESRADWLSRIDKALELLGLEDGKAVNAQFHGAASLTHPVLGEACIQFQARAIAEVFPAGGPVKAAIIGEETAERQQQAKRKEDFLNFYYTEMDEEYFDDTDQMLLKLPIHGSVFRKSFIDPASGLPIQRHVSAIDFIAPYDGKTLQTLPRYTHRYTMVGNDIRRAISRQHFVDYDLPVSTSLKLDEKYRYEADKSDDRSPLRHTDDVVSEFYEIHCDIEVPGVDEDLQELAGYSLPYIVTIDTTQREVVRIQRNWKDGDETYTKRIWFDHFKFLPGLGFYGTGFLHWLAGLARGASGSINALLDSAMRANWQGGFISKDLNLSGDLVISSGTWKRVEATADELARGIYTPNLQRPSDMLFQLLGAMVETAQRFATTTEAVVGEASNTGPVGTTLALIEQGSKVFSAIHKRVHAVFRKEFKRMASLIYEFAEFDEYPYDVQGESRLVLRQDFDDRVDVLPVSDPNIFSSTQRIALAQAQLELVNSAPDLYGEDERRAAHRQLLRALNAPNIDEVLPDKNTKPRLDPVTENMRMMTGRPATAFFHQDHMAHMQVHSNFEEHLMTMDPQIANQVIPILKAHMAEHMAYEYQKRVAAQMGIALPLIDLRDDNPEDMPDELEAMLAQAAAQHLLPPPQPEPEQQEPDDFEREQARKDAAVEREQRRRDMAAEREQARRDAAAAVEADRLDLMEKFRAGTKSKPEYEEAMARIQQRAAELAAGSADDQQP